LISDGVGRLALGEEEGRGARRGMVWHLRGTGRMRRVEE